MKKFAVTALTLGIVLSGCASQQPPPRGWGYSVDYDFEANRPLNIPHVHYGIVADVVYVRGNAIEQQPTGTILSNVIGEEIMDAQQGKPSRLQVTDRPLEGSIQVLAIRLPGGDTLYSVQKSNSSFAVGQDVKILGTGFSHRVVEVD